MKRLAGVAVVLMTMAVLPSTSQAQTSTPLCEAVLVDTSGRVKDTATVEAAASRLAAAGVYVRVRVDSNVGSDADARMRALEASCPNWTVGANRRPDLVSVIVLTDTRKTGIYYGANYSSALDNSWRSIQAADMNPRFKEGFFDSGISDGLDAITKAITAGDVKVSKRPGVERWTSPGPNGSLGDAVVGAFILLVGMGFVIGLLVAAWKLLNWMGGGSSTSTSSSRSRDATGWVDGPTSSSRTSSRSSSSSRRSGGSSRGSRGGGGGGGSSSW
jgi:uncharacterized membrane protein YgcG